MDWCDVLTRKDLTLAEKRANYEADCKRRGREPYPEVYRK